LLALLVVELRLKYLIRLGDENGILFHRIKPVTVHFAYFRVVYPYEIVVIYPEQGSDIVAGRHVCTIGAYFRIRKVKEDIIAYALVCACFYHFSDKVKHVVQSVLQYFHLVGNKQAPTITILYLTANVQEKTSTVYNEVEIVYSGCSPEEFVTIHHYFFRNNQIVKRMLVQDIVMMYVFIIIEFEKVFVVDQ
jgi:hypothetical protein